MPNGLRRIVRETTGGKPIMVSDSHVRACSAKSGGHSRSIEEAMNLELTASPPVVYRLLRGKNVTREKHSVA
jgi:hypothetical protein